MFQFLGWFILTLAFSVNLTINVFDCRQLTISLGKLVDIGLQILIVLLLGYLTWRNRAGVSPHY